MQTSIKKHAERQTAIINHPTRMKFGENCEITDIATGYGFSVFAVNRSDDEVLFGCGINTDSQLGLQERQQGKHLDLIIYPTAIKLPKKENETIDDMRIKCMSAGRAHLVIVTKNNTIFTLGNNAYGQCGRQIIENELYKGSNIIHRIEKLNGLIDENDEIISVECGQDHTLFLTSKGKVYSCGWGADGQTGRGHYNSTSEIGLIAGDISNEKIIKLSSLGDCVLALNDKGEVFGWGNSEYGQLIDVENNYDTSQVQFNQPKYLNMIKNLGKIIDIAAGGSFCLVLNNEGDVFTWGYGILGFGPNVEQTNKPKRLLSQLFGCNDFNPNIKVESIYCGLFHMGAVNSDGDLFMWGKNREGCLGLGHKKDQYFPFKTAINAKVLKLSCGVDHCLALCKPFI